MSNTIGNSIKYTIFGESHSSAIGMIIDGIPAGTAIDNEKIAIALEKRSSKNKFTTPRKEKDEVKFLSGVLNGISTGAALSFIIENKNTISSDYDKIKNTPRPSHADYPAYVKYCGFNDYRGGGQFSGRLSACYVVAGEIIKKILGDMQISIEAKISKIGGIELKNGVDLDTDMDLLKYLEDIKSGNDSVGGIVSFKIRGVKTGFGEPIFDSCESIISHYIFSIPGVKGISFGIGAEFANKRGSEVADEMNYDNNGNVIFLNNNNGGILGGITNSADIYGDIIFKPTSSIAKELSTINLENKANDFVVPKGRHDVAFILRSEVIVESVLAMSLYDIIRMSGVMV